MGPRNSNGASGQLVLAVVEVDIAIDEILALQAAAAVELADELGDALGAQQVGAEGKVGAAATGRGRRSSRPPPPWSWGPRPAAGVAERIPGADAILMQRDHPLGRQRQQLHHQRADRGQARGPAREQQHIAIVGVHDLGSGASTRPISARTVLSRPGRSTGNTVVLRSKPLAPRLRTASFTKVMTSSDGLGDLGEEGLVGPRLGRHDAGSRIVGLGRAHEFERDRMGDLQGELLPQVALDHVLAAAVAAHQPQPSSRRDWRCRRRASPPRSAAGHGPARRVAGCRRPRR